MHNNNCKRLMSLTFGILLLFTTTTFGQDNTVTIYPEEPQAGESVTITYHPESADAAIQSPDELKLIFSFAPGMYNQPNEMEMEKTSDGWETKFTLSEEFQFASFYFKSGESTDKNTDGHHFEFFAYQDSKPVEGAHLMKANSFGERYQEISNEKLANLKAAEYVKEIALYPDSYDGHINLYAFQLSQKNADTQAIKEKAYRVIDQKLAEDPGSWQVISDVKSGYQKIGEKAKGDSVQQAMIEKYPESDIAMYDLYQKASQQEDKKKQAQMLQKYINADYERSFVNKYYTENAYKTLFEFYAEQGDLDKAKQMAEQWLEPSESLLNKPIKSADYNSAAEIIVEHTNALDLALKYAQKALQKTDQEPPVASITTNGRKVRYVSEKQSRSYKDQRKSNILDTIGHIHIQKGEYDKAEEYLAKAIDLNDSQSAKKYTAKLYMQTDRPQKAFDAYWDILMEKPTDKEMRKQLKKAYIAYNGSEEGFKQKTQELDKAWEKEMVEKFNKERIDKEAPSFASITDLQGNPVDTEKFNNKVLVVDLWATWCGPCKSAFPYLQNIYDEYKNNPDVEFLVLNTGWNNTIKDARKWKKENDYTFPYYFDQGTKVTNKFGIRGIPTTFFIGKEGNIQFKKVGFEGPTMEPKMKLQIDMLLEEKGSPSTSSSR